MWVSDEVFSSEAVQKALAKGRVRVARSQGVSVVTTATVTDGESVASVVLVPAVEESPSVSESSSGPTYTQEQLEGFDFNGELRPLARTLGLSTGGTRSDIVQRILDHQETS